MAKTISKVARRNKFRISKVSFRANTQLKAYHMAHIEVEVIVPRGETAEEALEMAQVFVADQLQMVRDGKEEVVPQRVRRGKFLDRM